MRQHVSISRRTVRPRHAGDHRHRIGLPTRPECAGVRFRSVHSTVAFRPHPHALPMLRRIRLIAQSLAADTPPRDTRGHTRALSPSASPGFSVQPRRPVHVQPLLASDWMNLSSSQTPDPSAAATAAFADALATGTLVAGVPVKIRQPVNQYDDSPGSDSPAGAPAPAPSSRSSVSFSSIWSANTSSITRPLTSVSPIHRPRSRFVTSQTPSCMHRCAVYAPVSHIRSATRPTTRTIPGISPDSRCGPRESRGPLSPARPTERIFAYRNDVFGPCPVPCGGNVS